ncbi:tubulin-like doman-containing protein [Alteribacter natronophilus]|uniref:tubulin-like doman-containing protein n=1 Tax=Alteribacter natronophilus TaxID=2583810 RepID=UPI00110E4625|nr:tubulin-like doman-containing protein [Alteribacter natronophilus]TMW70433.1 phosphonate ABC transporter permease [Alteribacter natronophilus]
MSKGVPTILIGLGGIGSGVVNEIYGNIPLDRRENTAIHAFDTDVNTIRKMEHMAGNITQTSTRKSVGEYLGENESLKKWFPDNQHLRNKTMTEGAGQIRAVSRLAFRAAMGEKKLNQMEEGIKRIFPVDGDQMESGVRVIIISSLVGGTGSGIFLQVAMYLRELLEKKFSQSSVLIRGAFILPDILVRTNTLDQREWESVRANGYAALKELNAITESAQDQSGDKSSDVTIELEYRPDQVDVDGRTTHAITNRQRPFDFCFLYDYENTRGQNLPSVGEYIRQMSQTIYLQLFSPLSAKHFSQEDNQILEIISSDGKARYCGAGTSSLVYPYQDVLEYCSLKWSVNGLDESWLKLDEIYDSERRRYEQDLRRGINRERPDRGERFMSNLSQFVHDEKPNPFYQSVYRQTKEELEEGRLGREKADLFLQAVEERLETALEKDDELAYARRNCRIDESGLGQKTQARRIVTNSENSLRRYESEIEKKVYEFRTFLAHQILDQDADSPDGAEGQEYRINTWFLKKDKPLHPVAVRYMLYNIKSILKGESERLRTTCSELKERIKTYDRVFNIQETDQVETAAMRVDMALSKGFFSNLFARDYKNFIEDYKHKFGRQLRSLDEYKTALLKQLVFNSIEQAVDSMIQDWERFFENLKDTRASLLREINQLAVKFDENRDPTVEYVLAEKEMLEKTWESLRGTVDQGELPDAISRQIYLSHYRQYAKRNEQTFGTFREEIKVEQMYREQVVSHCREELSTRYQDRLDISIVTALRREADLKGANPDDHIAKRISTIDHVGLPFVPSIENSRELKFFGIHSDLADELGETAVNDLFEGKEEADEAFSKYEILSYRAHYGLKVEDFAKFSSGTKSDTFERLPGAYYEAYRRRVDKLNRGEATVTPHLDRNWHLPAFMPDLNSSQVELDSEKNDRALLLGLIYGWIQLVREDDGRLVYQYNGKSGATLIRKGGASVPEETFRLHHALAHNPNIYEEILVRAEEQQLAERRSSNLDVDQHDFVKGCLDVSRTNKEGVNNILDFTLGYDFEGMSDEVSPEKGRALRQCLLNEIESYYVGMSGGRYKKSAQKKAADLIDRLWEESLVKGNVDPLSQDHNDWRYTIENKKKTLMQLT